MDTPYPTIKTLTMATNQLIKATRELYKAKERKLKAESIYTETKIRGADNGEIAGTNEAKRDLSMKETHPDLWAEFEAAKAAERKAELDYKLAKLHLSLQENIIVWIETGEESEQDEIPYQ